MIDAAEKTFTVALGRGARRSTGFTQATLTLADLFKRLSTHEVGAKNNAECLVPGELAPCPTPCLNHGKPQSVDCGGGVPHRLNANVRSISVLFVDLDDLDAEALMRNVAAVEATGLLFFCYSTPSYAPPGKANARFVFPLAEPVPANRWKRLWAQLIAETRLEGADPNCCDPSRLYYLPTKPTTDAPTFIRQGGTRLLHESAPVLKLVQPGSTPYEVISALRAYVDYPGDIELVERIARGEPLAEEGGRHKAILDATKLLARVGARSIEALMPSLRAMGDDEDHIAEAERMFATAPVEDSPEVVEFNERQEELAGTDQAFAKRFVRLCGDRARYVAGLWHVWNGQRWEPQEDAPLQLAASLRESYEQDHKALRLRILDLREKMQHTPSTALKDKIDKLLERESKFYKRIITPTQNAAPASSFLRVAATMLTADVESFDADPWLLNCRNGTLDLRTGVLWPHDPTAMCSKLAPTNYNPDARSPLFERTLEQVLPDPEVRDFFQRMIGYSLTGVTTEDLIFILLGPGGNGKSSLIEPTMKALGDYAGTAPKSLLMSSRFGGTRPHELADLRGRRFVSVMELSQREYMDSSRLKSVVGGDRITADRKFENQITFTTQAKIFMRCNHKPRINDDDDGAWRRIALIEFKNQFLTDDRNKQLRDQLSVEASEAILAWAVRGCLAWQRGGLRVPEACRQAVAEYRHEENPVAQFTESRIERGEGQILSARVYADYRDYSHGEGVEPVSHSTFSKKFRKLGFEPYKSNGQRMWKGIKALIT